MIEKINDCAIEICDRAFHWRTCRHWKANLLLVIATAVFVALSMRGLTFALLIVVPLDSHAGAFVMHSWLISDGLFYTSAGVSALGGATSLLKDLRETPASFSVIGAIGHMAAAQFAGLITFLVAMYMAWPAWLSLALCGMAGWRGNIALQRWDKALQGRMTDKLP